MSQHTSNHSWHTSNTLQEDESSEPFLLGHLELGLMFFARRRMSVPGYKVHAPSKQSNGAESYPVCPVLRFPVSNCDPAHLFFGITSIVSTHYYTNQNA